MNSYITDQSPAGAFETITVSSTAIGLTSSLLVVPELNGLKKRAVRVFFTVESNSIRLRFDGSDPTASVGHLLIDGDHYTIEGEQNLEKLRFIRVGSDATVQATIFYNR